MKIVIIHPDAEVIAPVDSARHQVDGPDSSIWLSCRPKSRGIRLGLGTDDRDCDRDRDTAGDTEPRPGPVPVELAPASGRDGAVEAAGCDPGNGRSRRAMIRLRLTPVVAPGRPEIHETSDDADLVFKLQPCTCKVLDSFVGKPAKILSSQ